jgi:hypothetical protein
VRRVLQFARAPRLAGCGQQWVDLLESPTTKTPSTSWKRLCQLSRHKISKKALARNAFGAPIERFNIYEAARTDEKEMVNGPKGDSGVG